MRAANTNSLNSCEIETDSLTGFYIQDTFLSLLAEKFSSSSFLPVGLLYIEFDELARFNDTFGFDIDDQLLVQLSKSISTVLENGLFARVGTYRFAIALENADKKILKKAADTIINLLREPFNIGDNMFYVTATIGMSLSSSENTYAYRLLKDAENTMRCLQKKGKNYTGFYTEEKNPFLKQELHLMKDLPAAIDNDELYFVYQPQYSHSEKKFIGAEILTRWKHPYYGEVSAGTFIPLAEKSGMIGPLTTKLLIEASKIFLMLDEINRKDFSLSVNIPPIVLMENGFLDMLRFLMEAYGLSGRKLHFEIMEDTIPENMDTFIMLLEQIRKMGIGIAIDDYGTGNTSLKYLMHFPIDCLKIDRSFVTDIDKNKKTFLLFKTIIDMAKALNMKIIAEGVENHLEDAVLQRFDDVTVQGYLYSKPLEQNALFKALDL